MKRRKRVREGKIHIEGRIHFFPLKVTVPSCSIAAPLMVKWRAAGVDVEMGGRHGRRCKVWNGGGVCGCQERE